MTEATAMGAGRRYGRGFAVGALLAGIVFFWTLTAGTWNPGHRVPYSGDFYDVQAHRILEGHLSMPPSVLGIEGYQHDGNSYMYFGPVPALLRLPVAAVTHSLDGETGVVSMSVAFVVLMVALGRLSWRVRRWARPGAPVDGAEEALAGATAFVLAIGTTVVFIGLGPYVYHEAILWGLAFAFAAFDAILTWVERPRPVVLGVAAALSALALLTRLALGLGPAAALALLAVGVALPRLWRGGARISARLGLVTDGLGWKTVGALAGASLGPLALYAALNVAKFGTLFGLPFKYQAASYIVPGRLEVLAANHGTLFNVRAVPTNLFQYLRPDAVSFAGSWPFVQLPGWRPSVFGGLRYDYLDHTSSVTATMPLVLGFAIVGIVAMVRARAREGGVSPASLCLPVLGAACGAVPSLVFVYITQRYIGDFLPVLVLPALAGLWVIVKWARAERTSRRAVGAVTAVVVVLAVWSCVANVSIARDYQLGRERSTATTGGGG